MLDAQRATHMPQWVSVELSLPFSSVLLADLEVQLSQNAFSSIKEPVAWEFGRLWSRLEFQSHHSLWDLLP